MPLLEIKSKLSWTVIFNLNVWWGVWKWLGRGNHVQLSEWVRAFARRSLTSHKCMVDACLEKSILQQFVWQQSDTQVFINCTYTT